MGKLLLKINKNIWCKDVNKKNNFIDGFTLIELMVATSVFIVIMLSAISSLNIANSVNKRSQQLGLVMDNVNFAMESMTRSLRMGTNYICKQGSDDIDLSAESSSLDCGFDTVDGGYLVAFKPSLSTSSGLLAYKLNKDTTTNIRSLQKCDSKNICVDMTSSNVDIDTLKFFVIGAEDSKDGIQPSVYIIMRGTVTVKGESTSFAIQTMASQRATEQ